MNRLPIIYGAVIGVVVLFISLVTGIGGSIWMQIGFSVLCGLLGAVVYGFVLRAGRSRK